MKKVGDYELQERIGAGQFGEVYKGIHIPSKQQVAVKSMAKARLDERALKAIHSEIEIMRSMHNPHIVKLYNIYETTNHMYMFLEYCSGGDLEEYVKSNGRVDEERSKRWLSQLLGAMIDLKMSKVMHRDIKLANVLLSDRSPNATVKLADFGFARYLGDSAGTLTLLGTPLFMAPEILNHLNYNYKADVWSFGVFSYEIMLGRSPFRVRNLPELIEKQKEEIEFPPNVVSEDTRQYIKDLMVYDPEGRPNFENILDHPFFTSRSPPVAPPPDDDVLDILNEEEPMDKSVMLTMNLQLQNDEIELCMKRFGTYKEKNLFSGIAILYSCRIQLERLLENVRETQRKDPCNRAVDELIQVIQNSIAKCSASVNEEASQIGIENSAQIDEYFVKLMCESIVEVTKEELQNTPQNFYECQTLLLILNAAKVLDPTNDEAMVFYMSVEDYLKEIVRR